MSRNNSEWALYAIVECHYVSFKEFIHYSKIKFLPRSLVVCRLWLLSCGNLQAVNSSCKSISRRCRNAFLIYLFLKVSQLVGNSVAKASKLTLNVFSCKLIVVFINAYILKTELNFRRSWIYTSYLLATVSFPFSELGIMSYCLLAVADLTIDASSRTLQCYNKLTTWFALLIFISFMNWATSLPLQVLPTNLREMFLHSQTQLSSWLRRIHIFQSPILILTSELTYSLECILCHLPYS